MNRRSTFQEEPSFFWRLFTTFICESSRSKEEPAFLWNKPGIFFIDNSNYQIYFDIYPLKNKKQGYSNNLLVYGGHIFTLYQLSQLQSFNLSQQKTCTVISELIKQKQALQNSARGWKCFLSSLDVFCIFFLRFLLWEEYTKYISLQI